MNRIALTLCALISISPTLAAEEEKMPGGDPGATKQMISYFAIGGARPDIESMNDFLTANGFADISQNAVVVGFGSNGFFRRFVSGLQFNGLFWKKDERGNLVTQFSGIYGLISAGFNILPPENAIKLYPLLDFGPGLMKLTLREDEVSFDDAVDEPSQTRHFWQGGLIIGFGAGFDYILPLAKKGKNIALGLRAGYVYDPTDRNDWQLEGADVRGGPDAVFSGPYARLTIGKSFAKPHKSWRKHTKKNMMSDHK